MIVVVVVVVANTDKYFSDLTTLIYTNYVFHLTSKSHDNELILNNPTYLLARSILLPLDEQVTSNQRHYKDM